MKILIVDDSAYARKRLVQLLTAAGHTALEADGGQAALELLADVQPDLLTVDLLMPGMDGLELISQVRARDAELPIVVYSADVQQTTREQAIQAGASWFLGKTDPSEDLLRIIERLTAPAPPPAFSAGQQDAFTEMMNVAMGQAAQALAVLLTRRVQLQVPRVEIMDAPGLRAFLEREVQHVGALVYQPFGGPVSGLAALILPYHHALLLVRDLLGTSQELDQLSSAEQSVFAEVGNIVLNACLACLGDQLHERLRIGFPSVMLSQYGARVADLLFRAQPGNDHAVVLVSRLTVGDLDLLSYIILILPQAALRRLLDSLAA